MPWTAIASFVSDLLGKIIGPLIDVWNRMRAERTARNLGRVEQGKADAEAGLKEAADANRARGNVGGSDDDIDRMLKPPGSRH